MIGGTGGEYGYGDLSSSNINNHMPSSNEISNNQLPHSSQKNYEIMSDSNNLF
jgi:hypothetical protein